MLYPIKVVDIELSQPISTIENLDGYMKLKGLVRLHGVPIGYVDAPITLGYCKAETLSKLILEQHSQEILCQLIKRGLASPHRSKSLQLEELINLPPAAHEGELPLVTVAVCTRDRPDDMKLCLEALSHLDYPYLDILVVDNAPQTEATKELIETHYPQVRYVQEPRPGLDWARNRAILEAKGEIIAYTDDDVVVDSLWVKALAQVFVENSEVMAVTGLVVPYELETEAQVLFEECGGFGRGFKQEWYEAKLDGKMPWWLLGTGNLGTGANMAYRRVVFDQVGYFDPALDVGTVTNGGGDLEMFFRILKERYPIVYQPKAITRHRHRQSYSQLKLQIANNGIGLYSYFVCGARSYFDERLTFIWIGTWWFFYWSIRRLWIAFKHPTYFPVDLIWAELKSSLLGLFRYPKAYKQAKKIEMEFGSLATAPIGISQSLPKFHNQASGKAHKIAVRQVCLDQPLHPLVDLQDYVQTRIFLTWKSKLIGNIDIENRYSDISVDRLLETILRHDLMLKQLYEVFQVEEKECCKRGCTALAQHYDVMTNVMPLKLPENVKISINLATLDRPNDLRNCLRCLVNQNTQRSVEIIVVDNHPESGLTPPIVAEFPGVRLVNESRRGLAYARNAGFVASTGEIVIATDDDVTLPPDWLEKIVAPFAQADVMIVTGNVLPIQLETSSQQFFEQYGGLGRGYSRSEVGSAWFTSFSHYAVPTWQLGATANAAFRSNIFSHSAIGLMKEFLGPGMPSGVGEDTYLFYKTIKAGYTLVYEPSAYVWHKHREEETALRRQLYCYSKGHVAYNLTTWLNDQDWRGLMQIFVGLPIYHLKRIVLWLVKQSDYPISLVLLEISGNLAGPWSLWQSHLRVKREGRSRRYIAPTERLNFSSTESYRNIC